MNILLAVGTSANNSAQVEISLNLSWGPKAINAAETLVRKVLASVSFPAATRAIIETLLKNELVLALEDTLKHGARIAPKLQATKCKLTNRDIRYKLVVR